MGERLVSPRDGERGFAAIAFVAVLVIAGIMIAGFYARSSGERDLEITLRTEKNLLRVRDALLAQALVDGRFPCPEDPTQGTDDGTADSCTGDYTAGRVPWHAIGLQEDDVSDAWGRPYTYVVDENATKSPYAPGRLRISEDDDNDGTADRPLARNRDFVLVGHGANGLGAIGGPGPALSPAEQENTDGDRTFLVAPYEEAGNKSFDDQLAWGALTKAVVTMEDAVEDLQTDPAGNSRSQPNFTDPNAPTANTDSERFAVTTTDPSGTDPEIHMDADGLSGKSCFYLADKLDLRASVIRTSFEVAFARDAGGAGGSRGEGLIALLLPGNAEDGAGKQATAANRLRCGEAANFGYYGGPSSSDPPTKEDPHRDASGNPALAPYKIGLEFDTRTNTGGSYQDPAQNHMAVLRRDPWHAATWTGEGYGGPSCTSVAEGVLDDDNGPRDPTLAALAPADAERVPPHACRWPFYDPTSITGDTAIPDLDWLEDKDVAVPVSYSDPTVTATSDGWYQVRLEVRHFAKNKDAWDAGCRYLTTGETLTAAATDADPVDRVMVKAWIWNPVHNAPDAALDITETFTGTTADAVVWHCLPFNAVAHDRVWFGFTQSRGSAAQGSQPTLRRFQLVVQ